MKYNSKMKGAFFTTLLSVIVASMAAINCPNPGTGAATINSPQASANKTNNSSGWSSTYERWDFQALVKKTPAVAGAYVLSINGYVARGGSYTWSLDSGGGSLTGSTSSSPTHVPPSVAGSGWLGLEGPNESGCDEVQVKIYSDCLARDRDNFWESQSCIAGTWSTSYGSILMGNTWNCHGGALHAYDGSGDGYVSSPSFTSGWSPTIISYPFSASGLASITSMGKGDVVTFCCTGKGAGHTATSIGGSSVWGANNAAMVHVTGSGTPGRYEEAWKFGTQTVSAIANDLHSHWPLAFSGWTMDYIVIYKKP